MKLNRATAVLFYIAALSIQIGLLLADDSSSEENGGGRRQQQTQYCRKIKRRCPMDLLQSGRVCGDDGRTYKNTCQLQRASCKIARTINVSFRGTCKEQEQEAGGRSGTGMSKQCQRVIRRCPKQYLNGPCCGTNDVTYPNECELHRYRCRNGIGLRKLRVKHQGACRIKVPTQPPITQAPPAPSTTLDPCHRHCGNDPRSTFVCGSDGVTYLSACHLEKIACSSGKTITVVHTGLCHPTEKPEPRPPTKPHYPAEPPTKPHVPAGPHSPAGPKVEKTTVIPTTGAGEPPPTARPVTPEKRVFPTTKVATPGPATVKPKCLIDGIQTRVQCDDGGVPPDTPQCPSNCEVTIDTKPVCGSDGKTYKTKCHLHREACLADNTALTVDYEGECVESVPGERDCDFCPGTMYAPCCGTDGISYYNECELRKYACYINDLTLMVAHEGVCREIAPPPPENPDCPSRCPLMIDPVCGTNGKTYNSICLLKSAACELMDPTLTVAYIGDCVVPTTPDPCVRDCPTSYDPVCGSDWTTYLNECFFRIAACRDPNLLKIHSGTCRMTIRSQLH